MVTEDGQRIIKPMRYQCRPPGKPAVYDTKFPGTYNARRDSLEGFWKAKNRGNLNRIVGARRPFATNVR